MVTPWERVRDVRALPRGRIECEFSCGHARIIDPVLPLATIRAAVLMVACCAMVAW